MHIVKQSKIQSKVQSKVQCEHGSTLLGNLIVLAAIMIGGLVGLKLFPAYSEYYSIKSVLQSLNKEPLNTMGKHDIESAFDLRARAAYVTTISGKDIMVDKNAGATELSVNYQVIKPIVANISVLVQFTASNLDQ